MSTAWIVLCVALNLWLPATKCQKLCNEGAALTFTLSTTRSNTTSWVTQVNVDHDKDKTNDAKWAVEIKEINRPTCECTETIRVTATLAVPPARVVPEYDYIPGVGYYKMHGPGKKWEEARRTCVREGGHLAIINSELESTILQLMFARTTSTQPYALIGFHDLYTEGQYLTIYDQPVAATGFNRWGGGQPDNVGAGENCGSVYRLDGSLNDIDCESTGWPFICEQEL